MQMSGHIHNLYSSTPGREPFVLIGNKVKPQASLDGTEKRKISAFVEL